MLATESAGSRRRARAQARICSRWYAVRCDTGCWRAAGSPARPAIRICVTLSATAAADSGASVPMSAASVWIMPIIKWPAPRWPLTVLAVSDCVSRSVVRKVGPGRRSTYCWNGASKWSSYGRVLSYSAKSPGARRAARPSCTIVPSPWVWMLTRK